MKKRAQKRYTTRNEILALIDKTINDAKACREAARACENHASAIKDNPDLRIEWLNNMEELDRLMAKTDRLENMKLKKLQNLLAEFDTVPMPVPGLDDEAVVMKSV